MKILKKENMIYVIIIVMVWMIIIIKLYAISDGEEISSTVPLTDAKFINISKKMDNIPKDTLVNFYYGLVNVGNSDLKIGYINPDCTCTKCYAVDSIIAPGDSTVVVMEFNTERKLGFYKLNSVVKLNTSTVLYKISAIVEVVNKDSIK